MSEYKKLSENVKTLCANIILDIDIMATDIQYHYMDVNITRNNIDSRSRCINLEEAIVMSNTKVEYSNCISEISKFISNIENMNRLASHLLDNAKYTSTERCCVFETVYGQYFSIVVDRIGKIARCYCQIKTIQEVHL